MFFLFQRVDYPLNMIRWYISLLSVMVSFLPTFSSFFIKKKESKSSKLIATIPQGCRLILDMRKLAVSLSDEDYEIDYEIDLTSNLDLAASSSHHSIVSARLSTDEHSAQ